MGVVSDAKKAVALVRKAVRNRSAVRDVRRALAARPPHPSFHYRVAVYFADVVAPRANSGTTSGNGAGVGAFFDLQNVQVLKGPQGTLFGRNTTGGAILLVPTKPTGTFITAWSRRMS